MTVRKVKGGYALFSHSGRKLSKVFKRKSSPGLQKRERQVNWFKHHKK